MWPAPDPRTPERTWRLEAQNLMHCSEWIGIFSAFFLRVVRATGLPKADTFGRSDPFVQLSVATKRRDDPADDWKEEYGKYIYRMICELLAEVDIWLPRITAAAHK